MINVLSSNAVDYVLDSRSGKTKDYNIGICCFSAKQVALTNKNKYCLAGNHINVSMGSVMFIGLL